ncbi:hypothetical protein EVAR_80381_1 [Eumeta japonica]|uniref:Uncharacterized protein n=1 Tax=Eumeta variegata TaxID=151549 RepID=A0A4C1VHN1_EUMVA|nr:hypothetical protein EVAR_80381_1 [Eumeta japonica]
MWRQVADEVKRPTLASAALTPPAHKNCINIAKLYLNGFPVPITFTVSIVIAYEQTVGCKWYVKLEGRDDTARAQRALTLPPTRSTCHHMWGKLERGTRFFNAGRAPADPREVADRWRDVQDSQHESERQQDL